MFSAIKFAFRRLLKTPGFTFTALTTLAVCLGANMTIYAVVDAIVVRSLPFPEPERLLLVSNSYPSAGVDRAGASVPNYFDRRGTIKAFESLALYQDANVIIGEKGAPNRVQIERVSPEFFKTLGVPLAMGAMFSDKELVYGADLVAVITDGFWRSYFNADPQVIGRTFLNDGFPTTVIGVLPRDYHFLSAGALFYRPAAHELSEREPKNRHANNFSMLARLAPGATLAEAQSQIDAFNIAQVATDPFGDLIKGSGFHTIVRPLHADHIRTIKPILILLQCGVLFLLLIGCVNLVNLLLIRAGNRAKEFAVRKALGARTFHTIADVLVETGILAIVGCLYGLLLGIFGIDFLHALGTDQLPLGASIVFSGRIAAVSFGIAIAVCVLLAGPVILSILRMKLSTGLQLEARGGTGSPEAQRLRHFFIVAQVALAFVLLCGAGLLGVSLKRIVNTPSGFRTDQVLTGVISLPWKNYQNGDSRLPFVERLITAIKGLPGVTAAAIDSNLPFSNQTNNSVISIEGRLTKPGETLRAHYCSTVTSEYWKLMEIKLLQGRVLDDADNHRKEKVCVVDKAFADYYWPNSSPLGNHIEMGPVYKTGDGSTIVGVVANVKQNELTEDHPHGSVYFSYSYYSTNAFFLVVRTALPSSSMGMQIRKTILTIDPELPIDDLKVMQARIDDSLVERRSPAILAAIFAAAALLLAALGTYGVLSYAVSQRQVEIGVRIALGARPNQIRMQFLLLGARLLAAGAVLGFIGAWCAGAAMQAMLFNVPALHLETFLATFLIMTVVALSACFFPARRATKIDPSISIRAV